MVYIQSATAEIIGEEKKERKIDRRRTNHRAKI